MAANPVFATTPVLAVAQISTANTNRDGTGTLGTLLTGAASGTIIHKIEIESTGTVTAGVIRLFLDLSGTIRLLQEILVPATTPSTSSAAWRYVLTYQFPNTLILPSNSWILKASTHNAEAFNIFVHGASL